MSARALGWLTIASIFGALVAGTALDEAPARPRVMRGGYRLLEADLHAHTRFSDGFLSPFDVVIAARRSGLDVIAVTEHNMLFPAKLAAWFSSLISGPTVVVGEEITRRGVHLVALGLEERVPSSMPVRDMIAEVHRQGGVVAAAHPVRRFWPKLLPLVHELDAMELVHPIRLRGGSGAWNPADISDFREEARRRGRSLAVIGSSDYHFFKMLGTCRTYVLARDASAGAIVEAIAQRRTVVREPDGELAGEPEWVALLEREPPLPSSPPSYESTSAADAIARTVGFIGMLLLCAISAGLRGRRYTPTP